MVAIQFGRSVNVKKIESPFCEEGENVQMQHHAPGRSINLDGTVQGIVIIFRVILAPEVSGGRAGYGAVEDAELESSPRHF